MTSNELEIFKQSILDDVRVMMQTTGQVTQYIGARYVPLFADPIEWDDQREYEPLTVVTYQGNSFTSCQFTPKGIAITDESFWVSTGNYNAQIEQYRREVKQLSENLTGINKKISSHKYHIKDYSTDGNYSDGFSKIMNEITTGGTIIIPSDVTIEGACTINKDNVTIIGGGEFSAPLEINTPINQEDTPSDSSATIITGMRFTGSVGININHAPGLKVSNCDFNNSDTCIKCVEPPKSPQYNAQMIFTGNTIRSDKYGIYFSAESGLQTADCIITNNIINNKITNIFIKNSDGANISNNVLFLSLGGTTKKQHIYLDNANFCIIDNNEMFECGEEAIKIINNTQTCHISNNNIIWAAQVKRTPAIYISSSKKDVYFNISDNTIERPSDSGIYIDTNFPKISNNYIIYPGDINHIVEGTKSSTSYGYSIPNATHAYLIGNIVLGNNINNTPNMKKGLELGIVRSEETAATRFFTKTQRRDISSPSQFVNTPFEIPLYFIMSNLTVSKEEFSKNTSRSSFVMGIVVCYYGSSLTIGENKVVEQGNMRQFVIANGDVTWFQSVQIGAM